MNARNAPIPISLGPAPVAALLMAAFAAAAALGCSGAPGRGAAPLAGFKDRTGGARWDQVAILETRGTLSAANMTGEFTSTEDVRDGRSRTEFTLGPVTGAEGFDGRTRWRRDPGGEVVHTDSAEDIARSETQAWLTRRGYFREGGARYRDLGSRELEGRRYAVIEAVPERGAPIELWIEAATRLLVRTVHREGQDTVVTTYSDYRPVGGVSVPYRIVSDPGDPRGVITTQITAAEVKPAAPAEMFAAPATAKESVGFTGAARTTELPFELLNNHIFISVEIDGRPARVLVDTGGLNVLTQDAAKRLGVPTHGKLVGRGTGEEQVDVSLARVSSLQVGEIRAREPVFFVFEMAGLADIEGADFDGIVGFELFHRFAVRIDYAGRRISLTDPAAFQPPAGAIRVPFVLDHRMPRVDGTIDGTPARLTIDTGARNSLTASGPFVKKHGLVARYKPRFETVTGYGVGGPVRASPVRFGEVTLGAVTLRGVAGDLFTGESGAHADPEVDGNVGGGILRRFTVTFDYGQRAMYLEPNAAFAERDSYDRVGVFLKRAGGGFEVIAVAPGSPAERAGVRAGDRITAIDGAPPAPGSMPEWRRRFRESPVGTKLAFTVERDGHRHTISITLADLVP